MRLDIAQRSRRALRKALLIALVFSSFSAIPAFGSEMTEMPVLPNLSEIKKGWADKIDKLSEDFREKLPESPQDLLNPAIETFPLEVRRYSETQSYAFQRDIRPILERKCAACHGCYDAPCQLKLDAAGIGLARGATKTPVYNGSRLSDIPPTRLHIDGSAVSDWRNMGFFPVLPADTDDGAVSLMQEFIDLGRTNPLPNDPEDLRRIDLGLDRRNSCPVPGEFSKYAADNPHGGMPYAVAGLSDAEYKTLSMWLSEGGKIDPPAVTVTPRQRQTVAAIERWFNRTDDRAKLVARYIYEHLFLANLYLSDPQSGEPRPPVYFRLIRSRTPSGETPVPIATVRPNDPAGGTFHYRLVPVTDTILHKSHIAYRMDADRLSFYDRLFFSAGWTVTNTLADDGGGGANPFITFGDIPAKVRYRFLLNNAEFIVRNFIRGPVCNGQIATDVIRDWFWVMFEDPNDELYVNDPEYRASVDPLLGVPGQESRLMEFGAEWLSYQKKRNAYFGKRQKAYGERYSNGARMDHLWDGDGTNRNAFLTVFRHHTNASVTRGWHGALPLTAWIMDYPLLERTFYELVVGFNVFGGIDHQAQTRLYFDLIRNEGEMNFLRLLPAASRQRIVDHWYQGMGQIKTAIVYQELDTETPTGVPLESDQPKNELLEIMLNRFGDRLISPDTINRCHDGCSDAGDPERNRIEKALRRFAARPASEVPGIRYLPEVSFLRVDLPDGTRRSYSLLRDRRHSNVAFMLGEELRYQEMLDAVTVMPTLIGSYPNLMFRIDLDDIERFSDALVTVGSTDDMDGLVAKWGVGRMDTDFWQVLHSFSEETRRRTPLDAGLYDVNRYGPW